jgi:hypothetical protein
MPYTIWSRGRLLGTSALAYARAMPGVRAGDFEPTDLGERLLPIIIGVGPALKALYDVVEAARPCEDDQADGRGPEQDDLEPEPRSPRGFSEAIRRTTEYADAMSLADELRSLDLELRDPDGTVVPTESISVQDTHYLLAMAREGMEGMDFEDDELEPWMPPPPRYQIIITLEGGPFRRTAR